MKHLAHMLVAALLALALAGAVVMLAPHCGPLAAGFYIGSVKFGGC